MPAAAPARLVSTASAWAWGVLFLLAAAGCSKGEKDDGATGPVTPPPVRGPGGTEVQGPDSQEPDLFAGLPGAALPDGIALTIDGVAVDPLLLRMRVGGDFAAYADARPGLSQAALLDGYFADPAARCAELVEEVLVLRYAAESLEPPSAVEIQTMQRRLHADASRTLERVEQVGGAAAAAAWVHGRLDLERVEAEFVANAQEPTEEELLEIYERDILVHLPPPEQRQGSDDSFDAWKPRLQAQLLRERGLADLQAWRAGRREAAQKSLSLPGREPLEW